MITMRLPVNTKLVSASFIRVGAGSGYSCATVQAVIRPLRNGENQEPEEYRIVSETDNPVGAGMVHELAIIKEWRA